MKKLEVQFVEPEICAVMCDTGYFCQKGGRQPCVITTGNGIVQVYQVDLVFFQEQIASRHRPNAKNQIQDFPDRRYLES